MLAQPLPLGTGSFEEPSGIKVWYYKPTQFTVDMRIMVVLHGVERRAELQRDHWKALADQYGLFILAPEFTQRLFPRQTYQFGNIEEANPEKWTFNVLEKLFANLRAREKLTQSDYYLFGHSAGAQFVHRFMLFMPHHHVKQAVAANAGTYTMPAYDTPYATAFPMRIVPERVPPAQLQQAFRQNLVIMLGERDVNEEAPNLAHSAAAKLQGKHRFERGQHFFQTAQTEAARLQTPSNWQLVTVPGVGHNSAAMAKAAADYLFAN